MKRLLSVALVVACGLAVAAPRWSGEKKAGRVKIAIYRVAPGKHLEFLRWMAAQEDVAREAGVRPVQVYAHLDGDDWDYLAMGPVTTADEDAKLDEVAARKGIRTGVPASIEFRELLSSHSDTFAAGPMSAHELIAEATRPAGGGVR